MLILTVPIHKHLKDNEQNDNIDNRSLTSMPQLPESIKQIRQYFTQMDGYLSDQFGYRSLMIQWNNEFKYNLFKEVSSPQITIGKDGFIFFNSHNVNKPNALIKQACGKSPINQQNHHFILETFSEFISYYTNKGYHTAVAIIPTKSRIYPEKLPNLESQWCDINVTTWLDKNIQALGKNLIYYPLNIFRQWKKDFDVYLPNHFHWNGSTPYFVAEDIMHQLWNIKPLFDVTPVSTIIKSDLNRFLHGLYFSDKSVKYKYKDHGVTICRGKSCLKKIKKFYKNAISFHFTRKNATGRRLLILSDSFGAAIAEHFIRGFDEVILIDLNYIKPHERVDFYKNIMKLKNPTHFLHVISDVGVYNRAKKFNTILKGIKTSH